MARSWVAKDLKLGPIGSIVVVVGLGEVQDSLYKGVITRTNKILLFRCFIFSDSYPF